MDSRELAFHRESWCEANLQKWKRDLDPDSPWGSALCPIHGESKESLRINLETGGWKCLGCDKTGVLRDLANLSGLSNAGLPVIPTKEELKASRESAQPAKPKGRPRSGKTVAEYVYRDSAGAPIMKVLRFEPKAFSQMRYQQGEWISGLSDTTKRVPFRLPEILPATEIYWVEGEKDALLLASLELAGTTSPQGAGSANKLDEDTLALLASKTVFVLPDNDDKGKSYARLICAKLQKAGAYPRYCELDGLEEKGDVSDWLATHTATQLTAYCASCDPWEAAELPALFLGNIELHVLSAQAVDALKSWNKPPRLFCDRSGKLAWLNRSSGEYKVDECTSEALRGFMSESAHWWRRTKNGDEYYTFPDLTCARDIIARHPVQFPRLDQVCKIPVFEQSGNLLATSGYHESSRLFLDLEGLTLPPVPPRPNAEQVATAKEWIFNDLLVDFPFVDDASRCHIFCALVLPFVRRMTGPTPLHLIDSPTQGTGKSLLAELVALVTIGREDGKLPYCGDDEDEWRKRILSTLYRAPLLINIDNVGPYGIRSDSLAAALTSEIYEDRELGSSRNLSLLNHSTWICTGNNVDMSLDIARRTLVCRIDRKCEDPQLVLNLKHNPIRDWALKHRSELVFSLLVLVQHWISLGKPLLTGFLMGSFEKHNQVLGGICQVNNIPGFMGNYKDRMKKSDLKTQEWAAFYESWDEHPVYSLAPQSASSLCEWVVAKGLLDGALGRNPNKRQALGRALSGNVDRVINGLQMVEWDNRGPNKAKQFKLIRMDDDRPARPDPPPPPDPLAEVTPEMVFE